MEQLNVAEACPAFYLFRNCQERAAGLWGNNQPCSDLACAAWPLKYTTTTSTVSAATRCSGRGKGGKEIACMLRGHPERALHENPADVRAWRAACFPCRHALARQD